jgi:hypothetical protein
VIIMTQLPETLKTLVRDLRIGADGSIFVRGQRYTSAHSARGRELLDKSLEECIYSLAYTRANDGLALEPAPVAPHDDIASSIASANTTASRTADDWRLIEHLQDGSVLAGRDGGTRQFRPGQFFILDSDFPAQPGARILAHSPGGSRTLQPGFYYCFSNGIAETNDRSALLRIYWNVQLAKAPLFVNTLTGVLNRYRIPFQLKITTRRSDFSRADNAVLYVAERWFRIVALALGPVMRVLECALDPGIPLFTKRLGKGVAFAEDPGQGESFGSSRCRLAAAAILAGLNPDGQIDVDTFRERFRDEILKAGLRPDALYLNPGSEDIYAFPHIADLEALA